MSGIAELSTIAEEIRKRLKGQKDQVTPTVAGQSILGMPINTKLREDYKPEVVDVVPPQIAALPEPEAAQVLKAQQAAGALAPLKPADQKSEDSFWSEENKRDLYRGIVPLAATLAGYVFGGNEGGQAGAQIGLKEYEKFGLKDEQKRKAALEAAKGKREEAKTEQDAKYKLAQLGIDAEKVKLMKDALGVKSDSAVLDFYLKQAGIVSKEELGKAALESRENIAAAERTSREGMAKQKAAAVSTKPQKFTKDQLDAAGFSSRMAQSAAEIEDLYKKGFDPTDQVTGQAMRLTPSWATGALTPEMQRFMQARRDFINAALRRESGAAISQSEFENAEAQYFEQPGDSPEVVAQKKRNRAIVIESMKNAASGAPSAQPQVMTAPSASPVRKKTSEIEWK